MNLKISILLIALLGLTVCVYAQDEEAGKSADEIAKELANPNATLGFFVTPIDYISYRGDLPDANSQSAFKFNFQPSLPYPLAEGHQPFCEALNSCVG